MCHVSELVRPTRHCACVFPLEGRFPLAECDYHAGVFREWERLRSIFCECAVCNATLCLPTVPAHCVDCSPGEEHQLAFEALVAPMPIGGAS